MTLSLLKTLSKMSVNIDRCVCYNVSFSEILEKSEKENITTLEEVHQKLEICDACGLCNPYVKEVLKHKVTVIDRIIEP